LLVNSMKIANKRQEYLLFFQTFISDQRNNPANKKFAKTAIAK